MAAATKARDTKQRLGTPIPQVGELGVEAATKIFQGTLVVKNAAGFLEPASAAAAKVACGRARRDYDNTAGAAGDIIGEFEPGVFKWFNKAGDLLADVNIGADATMEDDTTVRLTAAGSSPAGKVQKVDDDGGVWVLTFLGLN